MASDENIGATYGVGIGSGLQVCARDETAARAILESEPVEPPGLDDLALATQPTTEEPPKPERQDEASTRPVTSSGLDKLELASVLLVTSAYQILWNLLLSEPAGPPVSRGQMAVGAVWLAGFTCLVWILLRRGRGALAPKPLPATLSDWGLEIFLGVILFAVWYVFDASLDALLRAMVRRGPSHWDAFFRQPGVGPLRAGDLPRALGDHARGRGGQRHPRAEDERSRRAREDVVSLQVSPVVADGRHRERG